MKLCSLIDYRTCDKGDSGILEALDVQLPQFTIPVYEVRVYPPPPICSCGTQAIDGCLYISNSVVTVISR